MKKKILSGIIIVLICMIVLPHELTKDGLCVLGYHGVELEKDDDMYSLCVDEFEKQMKYLYDNGYTTYSMEEVELYHQGKLDLPKKAVVLTFDDGLKNFNEVVKPILEKYGFKGTCFVIGKHLIDDSKHFLKVEDLKKTENVAYYSHSHNLHRFSKKGWDRKIIEDLSEEEIMKDFEMELVDDTYFAFPYGRSVEGIDEILKNQGVHLAFLYNQLRHMTPSDSCYELPRYMILDLMPMIYFRWVVQ